MPDISVRPFAPGDSDGYWDVRALTYNNGNAYAEEKRLFKHVRPFVAEQGGQIKGVYNILDLTCTRGSAILKCGGIAGVAVLPHERRSGVGKAMMASCVRSLRDEGIQLASLYAFRETYYRMFGYEVCGKRIEINCPTDRLPRTKRELSIRRLKPADWEQLSPCHTAFCRARAGMSLRNEQQWNRVLAENRELTIYAAGDPVEAYAVVSHSVNFFETDHISEVAWSTRRGYLSLFEVLRSIAINKTGLKWHEPSDSPFFSELMDQGVTSKIDRHIMFRVCDVPSALRELRPEGEGTLTIRVRDEVVPENEGPWRVSFSGSAVTVHRAAGADLELDIRQFTQAFLGEPSLADIHRAGLVAPKSLGALKSACELLPPLPVYCLEFF